MEVSWNLKLWKVRIFWKVLESQGIFVRLWIIKKSGKYLWLIHLSIQYSVGGTAFTIPGFSRKRVAQLYLEFFLKKTGKNRMDLPPPSNNHAIKRGRVRKKCKKKLKMESDIFFLYHNFFW